MQLTIHKSTETRTYDIASLRVRTLLAVLYEIKAKIDPELTFDAGCRSGICGRCAVRVDGREQLACSYKLEGGETIAPLQYHPVLRDLKVDKAPAQATLSAIAIPEVPTPLKDPDVIERPSACILCDSCYSACPVLAVDTDFVGPFALTRAWRYVAGSETAENTIDAVQSHGVWDCTLCGECTAVCPQGVDPKGDILSLRSASIQAGYSDPNFGAMDFGTPDFGMPDFGGGF